MKEELKSRIIKTIRREHGIVIDKRDPIFAIVTANDIILEEQLKELNTIFEGQLQEMEQITKSYLENGKELLEKKLTLALHDAKKRLNEAPSKNIKEERNSLTIPLITLVIGFILGYGLSLFLL